MILGRISRIIKYTNVLLRMFSSFKRRGAQCGQIPHKFKLQEISGGRIEEPYSWNLNLEKQTGETLINGEAYPGPIMCLSLSTEKA